MVPHTLPTPLLAEFSIIFQGDKGDVRRGESFKRDMSVPLGVPFFWRSTGVTHEA